jgi:hypothetical protein
MCKQHYDIQIDARLPFASTLVLASGSITVIRTYEKTNCQDAFRTERDIARSQNQFPRNGSPT